MSEQTIDESRGIFSAPCGGPDLIRELTDAEVTDIACDLFALARQYGAPGRHGDGTTAGRYLQYLALHPGGEKMREPGLSTVTTSN